jgi:hypothetical protein
MRVFIPTIHKDQVRDIMLGHVNKRWPPVLLYAYWYDEICEDKHRLGFLVSDKPLLELGGVDRDFRF